MPMNRTKSHGVKEVLDKIPIYSPDKEDGLQAIQDPRRIYEHNTEKRGIDTPEQKNTAFHGRVIMDRLVDEIRVCLQERKAKKTKVRVSLCQGGIRNHLPRP